MDDIFLLNRFIFYIILIFLIYYFTLHSFQNFQLHSRIFFHSIKFWWKIFPKLLILFFTYFFVFSTFFFHTLYFFSFFRECLMRKEIWWRNIKSLNIYWRLLQGLVFFSVSVILFSIYFIYLQTILLSDSNFIYFYFAIRHTHFFFLFCFLTMITIKFFAESIYFFFSILSTYYSSSILIINLNIYFNDYSFSFFLIFFFICLYIVHYLFVLFLFSCRTSFISHNGTKVWKTLCTMPFTSNLRSNPLQASVHTAVNVQKI